MIRLLVTDIDGCWTDCAVWVDGDGRETCRYSKRDGVLLPAMREAGIEVVALTSEQKSGPHAARAAKLGVPFRQTTPDGKLASLVAVAAEFSVPLSDVAYLGDDLPDLPCLEAVAAAFIPYRSKVQGLEPTDRHVVSAGGEGALRDVCEALLRERGYDLTRWPVTR